MEYQNKTITLKDGRTALLRAVCKEDAVPMIAYMKACYEQTPYLMRYPDEFAVTAEQEATYLERQLVSPDVLMLVCEVEGKLAGNCQLDLNRWRKTRHRGQVAIALLKDYWGLGIGTAMFKEMIDKARQEKLEQLELEVIADVGLIGFPNVGKSTLISTISAARPKIANYHFTTLTPVLGVVRVGPEQSFVCADIPGLIEGAADGVGLGHDFLRHVERCRLLLHVVDVSGCEGRDPKEDFEQINHELEGFSADLATRPQIVLGNKCDIATPEQVEEFKQFVEAKGLTFVPISAATRQGVDALPAMVYSRLKELPPVKVFEAEYVKPSLVDAPTRPFTVERTGAHEFTVDAPWLERILAGTNVEDYESLQYFQTQLGDSGILDELVRQNVEEDDTIKIGEYEFDYVY